MAKTWEIRGLFGNEYAMEEAIEDLKRQGVKYSVLDRRNLSVRLDGREEKAERMIRRTFEIHHGFVESEAPLGAYDAKRESERQKKMRELEKKRKTSH